MKLQNFYLIATKVWFACVIIFNCPRKLCPIYCSTTAPERYSWLQRSALLVSWLNSSRRRRETRCFSPRLRSDEAIFGSALKCSSYKPRNLHCLTACVVMAAMLVAKNNSLSLRWELNFIFMQIRFCEKKFYCIDHQHGRFVTCLESKNTIAMNLVGRIWLNIKHLLWRSFSFNTCVRDCVLQGEITCW